MEIEIVTWPQWVIFFWIVLGAVIYGYQQAKDSRLSSGAATTRIVMYIGLMIIYAMVLHEGGFW